MKSKLIFIDPEIFFYSCSIFFSLFWQPRRCTYDSNSLSLSILVPHLSSSGVAFSRFSHVWVSPSLIARVLERFIWDVIRLLISFGRHKKKFTFPIYGAEFPVFERVIWMRWRFIVFFSIFVAASFSMFFSRKNSDLRLAYPIIPYFFVTFAPTRSHFLMNLISFPNSSALPWLFLCKLPRRLENRMKRRSRRPSHRRMTPLCQRRFHHPQIDLALLFATILPRGKIPSFVYSFFNGLTLSYIRVAPRRSTRCRERSGDQVCLLLLIPSPVSSGSISSFPLYFHIVTWYQKK